MSDYISRQAAIEKLRNNLTYMHTFGADRSITLINEVPSADVQPVRHGHWMLYENQNQDDVNNGNYLYVCSNCNYSDIHAKTVEVPFCWHCGARMDGET